MDSVKRSRSPSDAGDVSKKACTHNSMHTPTRSSLFTPVRGIDVPRIASAADCNPRFGSQSSYAPSRNKPSTESLPNIDAATLAKLDTLSDGQQAVLVAILKGKNVFFSGSAGSGKCWSPSDRLMAWDGSFRSVSCIREGDELMGADGRLRIVKHGSITRGTAPMYEVSFPDDRSSIVAFSCNADHILVLKFNTRSYVCTHEGSYYVCVPEFDDTNKYVDAMISKHETEDDALTARNAYDHEWLKTQHASGDETVYHISMRDFMKMPKNAQMRFRMFQPVMLEFKPPDESLFLRATRIFGREITASQAEIIAWWIGVCVSAGVLSNMPKTDTCDNEDHLDRMHRCWNLIYTCRAFQSVHVKGTACHLNLSTEGGDGTSMLSMIASYMTTCEQKSIISPHLLRETPTIRRSILSGMLNSTSIIDHTRGTYTLRDATREGLDVMTHLARGLGFRVSKIGTRMYPSGMCEVEWWCADVCGRDMCKLGNIFGIDNNVASGSTTEELILECERNDLRNAFVVREVGTKEYRGFVVCGIGGSSSDGRLVNESFIVTHNSFLLQWMHTILPKVGTFFTASSGLAAVSLGGTTLHSFAGIQLGEGTAAELAIKVFCNRPARQRWNDCKVLMIDEISMIDGLLFDKIEEVARIVRRDPRPFGGVQLILSGDFLQLPPVNCVKKTYEASSWNKTIDVKIVLQKIFRQQHDATFADLLNRVRVGQMTSEDERSLADTASKTLVSLHGVAPTKLHAINRNVMADNMASLALLEGNVLRFKSVDAGSSLPHLAMLKKNCAAGEVVELKLGAQVMLLKNIDTDAGLCNGSRGIIVEIVRSTQLVSDARHEATRDGEFGDSSARENRVRALMSGGGWYADRPTERYFPRVRFENGHECIVQPSTFDIMSEGKIMASRTQIPLTLAYAITVHRAQGLTLATAEVNAAGMFEKSQLYVSISRVNTLAGLRLTNFTRAAMKTDMDVVLFYDNLVEESSETIDKLLGEKSRYFVLSH